MLSQLEEIVQKPGAKIVGMTTRTQPKLLKKSRITGEPCPHKEVTRITERTVIIACNYESCVNRQRAREDMPNDFRAEELWKGKGKHVENHPFLIEHTETGQQYVALMNLRTNKDDWFDENNNPLDPAALKDYLPKPQEHSKQGTDKKVFWRTIEISNVVAVRYATIEEQQPKTIQAA